MSHSYYLRNAFTKEQRQKAVERLLKLIQKEELEFDAVAVRGTSGLTVGSIIAHVLGKELCVIRKSLKDCHADYLVESPAEVKRYLIVDDCIDSGLTAYAITFAMKKAHPNAEFAGAMLYNRVIDGNGAAYRTPLGLQKLFKDLKKWAVERVEEVEKTYADVKVSIKQDF